MNLNNRPKHCVGKTFTVYVVEITSVGRKMENLRVIFGFFTILISLVNYSYSYNYKPRLQSNAGYIYSYWNSNPYTALRKAALKYLSAYPASVTDQQLSIDQIYTDRRFKLLDVPPYPVTPAPQGVPYQAPPGVPYAPAVYPPPNHVPPASPTNGIVTIGVSTIPAQCRWFQFNQTCSVSKCQNNVCFTENIPGIIYY